MKAIAALVAENIGPTFRNEDEFAADLIDHAAGIRELERANEQNALRANQMDTKRALAEAERDTLRAALEQIVWLREGRPFAGYLPEPGELLEIARAALDGRKP